MILTQGERMVWAAAFTAVLRECGDCPPGEAVEAWRRASDRRAARAGASAVRHLRAVEWGDDPDEHTEEDQRMLRAMRGEG